MQVDPRTQPKEPFSMHLPTRPSARWRRGAVVLVVFAAIAAIAGPALAKHSVHVHTAQNAQLGKKIVVTASGRTLYTLSAEVHGRFICTGSCLSNWHPLKVPTGAKVEGVAKLGVIKRPDGSRQATFAGRPLYTFAMDTKKGQANGEGFKDVGTWHAAVAPKATHAGATPSPQPTPGY
jgi:predicted lipoprotein with Yx(FWY)xxD motif